MNPYIMMLALLTSQSQNPIPANESLHNDVSTSHSTSIINDNQPHQKITQSRKSSRMKQSPSYLQDYHCHLASFPLLSNSMVNDSSTILGIPHTLSSSISYDHLSMNHKQFCLSTSSQIEPQFYHQAVSNPDWRDAVKKEIEALEENKT
jgi:hypothetical protein